MEKKLVLSKAGFQPTASAGTSAEAQRWAAGYEAPSPPLKKIIHSASAQLPGRPPGPTPYQTSIESTVLRRLCFLSMTAAEFGNSDH